MAGGGTGGGKPLETAMRGSDAERGADAVGDGEPGVEIGGPFGPNHESGLGGPEEANFGLGGDAVVEFAEVDDWFAAEVGDDAGGSHGEVEVVIVDVAFVGGDIEDEIAGGGRGIEAE